MKEAKRMISMSEVKHEIGRIAREVGIEDIDSKDGWSYSLSDIWELHDALKRTFFLRDEQMQGFLQDGNCRSLEAATKFILDKVNVSHG